MSVATIVSQSTPSGFSAVAVVRLSGPKAIEIAQKLSKNNKPFKHRTAQIRKIFSKKSLIDKAVFTAFLSPESYTGEDVVEVSCHGNIHICEATINEIVKLGARIAEPGEYTRRAFVNGKLNLVQAESIVQLINAKSVEAVKHQTRNIDGGITDKIKELKESLISILAYMEYELDVSEEVFLDPKTLKKVKKTLKDNLKTAKSMCNTFGQGGALSYGVKVAFVGKPNVGKSTLVNKILGIEKSIISNVPGTTRDTISTETTIGGIPTTLVDTAGIHLSENEIEKEGIKRSFKEIKSADLVVLLFCDGVEVVDINEDIEKIFVYNKIDLQPYTGEDRKVIPISASTGQGIASLVKQIRKRLGLLKANAAEPLITTIRQKSAMEKVSTSLSKTLKLLGENVEQIELPAQEVRNAINNIDLFTGKTTTNDVLDQVFSTFCVGK